MGNSLRLKRPVAMPVSRIGEAVEHENPHTEEVPLQAVLRRFADHDELGKVQPTGK